VTIRLTTFGGLRVVSDEGELDFLLGQRSRAALLVYLGVEREVSRDSLLTVFWPESDEESARHALRQSLYHLRGALGHTWFESRGREVRVRANVTTDVQAFTRALEEGDTEAAAKLYRGPFLDAVHLADLNAWDAWVEGKRALYARGFRKACRGWLEERRRAGDLGGAVETAERWVAPDPLDDEAQHELVRSLAESGERAEAIRQFEAYRRALEADDLRPLDETVALVDGLRRAGAAWPALRTGEAEGPVPAGSGSAPVSVTAAVSTPDGEFVGETAARDTKAVPSKRSPLTPAPSRIVPPPKRPGHFGLVATVFLAILTAGYLASRAFGIGPGASLVASGTIEPGEQIVLADFGSAAADPYLGVVITDALRIDLLESPILHLLEPSEIREVLDRMQVGGDVPLTAELAREVALREGIKAVLEGEVARAGTGYVLTATLRAAQSGESLAAFRETARSDADVIPAIDRLSRRIRERAGESLRSVRSSAPLERVTTSSLDALRLLSQADRAFERADYHRVATLLEEAVELDPEFAMAWRRLAVALGNLEVDRVRELEAATRAYELRHLLSPRERYLAVARYHAQVSHDRQASIDAYHSVLEIDPDDRVALNNLGIAYLARESYDAAADVLQRAVDGPGVSPVAFVNLVRARIALGDLGAAHSVLDAFAERYPNNTQVAFWRSWVLLLDGEEPEASWPMQALLADPTHPPSVHSLAHDQLARLALWHGRLGDARMHFEAAERIGREVGPSFLTVRRLFTAHAEVAVGEPRLGLARLREATSDGVLDDLPPADRWHFIQSIVFGMAGLAEEAEEVLRDFQENVPEEFHDQFFVRNESARAIVLWQQGDPEGAVRILERIRTSRRCRACYAERMGWALWDAGRLDEAAREWETALGGQDLTHSLEWQFTQNLWIMQHLPTLYEELGDTARAIVHHRRLADLWADADPELQPRVRHALERIAALTAE
jgi:DNA-binding SARP family transcriptional activator/tetratricopeptide (TPR) repeat protein